MSEQLVKHRSPGAQALLDHLHEAFEAEGKNGPQALCDIEAVLYVALANRCILRHRVQGTLTHAAARLYMDACVMAWNGGMDELRAEGMH